MKNSLFAFIVFIYSSIYFYFLFFSFVPVILAQVTDEKQKQKQLKIYTRKSACIFIILTSD